MNFPNGDEVNQALCDRMVNLAAETHTRMQEAELLRCLSEWVSEIEPIAYWRDREFLGIGAADRGPIIRAHPIQVRFTAPSDGANGIRDAWSVLTGKADIGEW